MKFHDLNPTMLTKYFSIKLFGCKSIEEMVNKNKNELNSQNNVIFVFTCIVY